MEPKGGAARLARLVRALRERALLTQEELAERSRLSVGTIRGLESGRIRHPRTPSIRQLADALALSEADRTALIAAARGEQIERSDAPQSGTTPAQLPAAVAGFTGRAAELKALDEMLAVDPSGRPGPVLISAVSGAGGVGKTALAVHWAHQVRDRFADGQLYANLRGFDPAGTPTEPATAIRGFLDALQVPPQRIPTTLDAQIGLYRSLLAGRRMLIVLDNAYDADQVRPLLPGASGCLVVVTSRSRLESLVAIDGARPLTLDPLPHNDARRLLASRLGEERVAAEPRATDEIIDWCGQLPLALVIVAARAAVRADFPLTGLAAQLRDAGRRLDELAGDDAVSDVRAVFSWSYRVLDPPAARLFRLLGLSAGPDISLPAAAGLAGDPLPAVRGHLATLAQASLIHEHSPGRYAFHDLVRAYAAELAEAHDSQEVRQTARHRLLDYYLGTCHACAMLIKPHRDPITLAPALPGAVPDRVTGFEQAMAWLTAERRVVCAAVDQAARTGFDSHAWQLAWAIMPLLERQGYWHDLIATQRAAVEAARRLGDLAGQAHGHRALGRAYTWLGDSRNAYRQTESAWELGRRMNDTLGMARSHINFAMMLEQEGNHEEALHHAQQALGLSEQAGHPDAIANAHNSVGWHLALLGRYEEALAHCSQALELYQEIGDEETEAVWDSLGFIHSHLGNHRESVSSYLRSLELLRRADDRYYEAMTLSRLGDAHLAAANPRAAAAAWQEALAILTDLEHHAAETVHAKLKQL